MRAKLSAFLFTTLLASLGFSSGNMDLQQTLKIFGMKSIKDISNNVTQADPQLGMLAGVEEVVSHYEKLEKNHPNPKYDARIGFGSIGLCVIDAKDALKIASKRYPFSKHQLTTVDFSDFVVVQYDVKMQIPAGGLTTYGTAFVKCDFLQAEKLGARIDEFYSPIRYASHRGRIVQTGDELTQTEFTKLISWLWGGRSVSHHTFWLKSTKVADGYEVYLLHAGVSFGDFGVQDMMTVKLIKYHYKKAKRQFAADLLFSDEYIYQR